MAAAILPAHLTVALHPAADLLPQVHPQEVHIPPDHLLPLLLQDHPEDHHPHLILQAGEDNKFKIWCFLDISFYNRSAGKVYLKMNIL